MLAFLRSALEAWRSFRAGRVVVVIVLPVGEAVLATLAGPELALLLRPIEEVIRQLGQKIFIRGFASSPIAGGRVLFDAVRRRLRGPRIPVSGRVPSLMLADDVGHVVAFGIQLRAAGGEIHRIVRGPGR